MSQEPVSPAVPVTPLDHRVGSIDGHRLCAACGFNLRGQPVLRERQYAMLIARCPECAAVAALQEYPTLGRWAGRWAMLLAALWFLALLAGSLLAAAGIYGAAEEVSRRELAPYSKALNREYFRLATDAWDTTNAAATTPAAAATNPYRAQIDNANEYGWVEERFFTPTTARDVLDRIGGPDAAREFGAVVISIPLAVWFALSGMVFGVAFAHLRRAGLLAVAGGILGLAIVLYLLVSINWMARPMFTGGYRSAYDIAAENLSSRLIWVALVVMSLALYVGMLIGRPIARTAIRFLLPPRLRAPLAGLWVCDGLAPPR